MIRIIGLIFIGIILASIIFAFIFSEKFRKDVIASEGEASVLGLINVKGVIIVLLTGIFSEIFAYIIKMEETTVAAPKTVDEAVRILKSVSQDSLPLDIVVDNGKLSIKCKDVFLGELKFMNNMKLKAYKDSINLKNWHVCMQNSSLGTLCLVHDNSELNSFVGQSKTFYKERSYAVNTDMDLYFKIENIERIDKADTINSSNRFKYDIRFGEGTNIENIKWMKSTYEFYKTSNGKVDLNDNNLKHLVAPGWNNNYIVGMGLGIPTLSDLTYKSVDLVNVVALKLGIE